MCVCVLVCVCALLIQILVSSSIPGDIQISKADVNLLRIERFSRREVHSIYTLHTPRLDSLGAHGLKCELLSLFLLLFLLLLWLLVYGMPCNCFDFSKSTITNADSSWGRSSTSLERFRYCLNATVKKSYSQSEVKLSTYPTDTDTDTYVCV